MARPMSLPIGVSLLALALCSCAAGDDSVTDIHSHSRPDEARVSHAVIHWDLDFAARALGGTVTWTVVRGPEAQTETDLVLDTKALEIGAVRVGTGSSLRPVTATSGRGESVLGAPLRIPLGPGDDTVEIAYRTTDQGACLQWLDPTQTADKTHPFMFSQAQSINARTMIPCQDTPGVRFTYEAVVTTPAGIRPVMAAEMIEERDPGGGYRFRMQEPIPSYLLAIAAGNISFRPLGPRTGVFAEPSVVDAAAFEFADTERMVEAAERLYGPYRWGRFDIIILPPSFPFGGMENPRLTFATPTILAKDRSLTALVAHELAHSWSGNLVTNATWSDFWLNEGFTVYFERRIMEEVYGKVRADMEAVLGRQDLEEDLGSLPAGDTVLHVDLTGRDPDDAFSNVPYEKGYLLLRLLDETFGRPRFDAFLREWFDAHAFESRTTADFRRHLEDRLLTGDVTAASLELDAWLHDPGLPSNAPRAESDAFERCERMGRAFLDGSMEASALPGATWTTHEWLHFLRTLPPTTPEPRLEALDTAWGLTDSGNYEILTQWAVLGIKARYAPSRAAAERVLTQQGRRKFLKPLYQELVRTEEGRSWARDVYSRARPLYHQIARNTIDEILGWDGA